MLPQDPVPVAITNAHALAEAMLHPPRTTAKPGPKPTSQKAVDAFLASHAELRTRQAKAPTVKQWAAVIAAEMARFSKSALTAGAVHKQLKGRWDFSDREQCGDEWLVRPRRND
jgi:hypothetical protein